MSVEIDGAELVGSLRGRQVPLVLAYLVLHRSRSVSRDELAAAIWPESAPQSQDGALRTLLSRLRSGLGNEVLTGRDELALTPPVPVWIDVEAAGVEIRRASEALDREDARAAWALAQVPLNIASRGLLPGAQATWLEPHRRELSEIHLEALEVIGRAGLQLGGSQLASVERAARALIETEPYRESGYVLLMGALEAQGNVAEGLRVFERLRGLLREELGTNPSPEALAAHERLLHPGGTMLADAPADTPAAAAAGVGVPRATALPPELGHPPAGPLVGRRQELAELRTWWTEPARERVLVLCGDAGIGKSRLLIETARQAHEAGAVVLAGRSPEETLVPYQPFLEALGHYAFTAPLEDLRAVTRRSGPELAQLIPEIRRRLPELGRPEPGDPETDRYRLFEAVAGLLGEISASASLLVVLDDVQWADRPTLLLLRHLARAPQASGLRILAARRIAEHGAENFETALTGLRHERLVREIELEGLSEADAAELVRQRISGTPSAAFVSAVYAGTEGNPFFIEEMVRHLTDAGVRFGEAGAGELQRVGLPQGVRGVISRRLERLDDDGLEWLRMAAVIGRDFHSALLERVLGFDEDRFLRSLEVALQTGVVLDAPGGRERYRHGRYRFSHALVRETLYAGMSADRRARMHRRVGIALEEQADPPIGALAHHFTRAAEPEDAERAIRYAVAAGRQATEMLANEEAADHYARALELLERFAPQAVERRCELLIELGEARVRSGERPAAWGVFREAASLAGRLGDGEKLARAAIGASRRLIQPPGVVDEELIALLQQALETVPRLSVTHVLLISRLCGALYFSSERREEMRRLSAEATAIAAQLGDPEAAALAAAARRRAYWAPGHLERRLADSTQLLRSAREAGNRELVLQGHAWLVVDLLEAGDRTAVEAQLSAFEAGARELRQPLFLWYPYVWRAMLCLLDGRLAEAERLSSEALSSGIMPEGVTAPQYYAMQLLYLRREQVRMGELEEPARALVASNPDRLGWRAALAVLLCQSGQTEEARELMAGFADERHSVAPDGDWLITFALLADAAAELGDAEQAAVLYDELMPYRDRNVVIGYGAVCFGPVSRYLGRLAMTIGRRQPAIEHLRAAVQASSTLRAPVHLAHARLDLAGALDAAGEAGQARTLVQQAAATASELELPFVAHRAQSLASPLGG